MGFENLVHSDPILGDTSRGPSGSIWATCPFDKAISDPAIGIGFFDDMLDWPLPGTQTTEVTLGRYKVVSPASGVWETINAVPTTAEAGGIVRGLADTDGDQIAFGTQASPFLLNSRPGGKLYFEARVAMTGIATNNGQLFVGLGENSAMTYGAAQPLGNADAGNTTGAMLGFRVLEDGLGVLVTSYQDRSATWTAVQTTSTAMAANTFIKLGFVYDPFDSTNALTFFINGIRQSTVVSQATITAFTNLDVKGLGPCIAFYADSAGTTNYIYCDWIRAFQAFA